MESFSFIKKSLLMRIVSISFLWFLLNTSFSKFLLNAAPSVSGRTKYHSSCFQSNNPASIIKTGIIREVQVIMAKLKKPYS